MLNVDKIYVLHYTKLKERKERLDEMFYMHDLDVEYITEFDQEDLTQEMIDESYDRRKESYDVKIHPAYKERSTPHRVLNMAEISCTFKHRRAIQKVAEECPNHGLIFEDDVILVPNFKYLFNQFLSTTPNDWGAIFMGCCANLRVPENYQVPNQNAYRMNHPASRGGDSYLLTNDAAKKIASTMDTFVTISDWELSYQLYRHDITTYWWEPPIVVQGSETGLYKTTLR
jgi:GR25 family glycosyltransferase involved in LPS biosynthesis